MTSQHGNYCDTAVYTIHCYHGDGEEEMVMEEQWRGVSVCVCVLSNPLYKNIAIDPSMIPIIWYNPCMQLYIILL